MYASRLFEISTSSLYVPSTLSKSLKNAMKLLAVQSVEVVKVGMLSTAGSVTPRQLLSLSQREKRPFEAIDNFAGTVFREKSTY